MALNKNVSLRHLTTFQTVARFGSVTLAADELHLSQSAVSIQIAGLETAAGAPLVVRTGRGVRLTEAGELLLRHADRMLALWNEASDEVASLLGAYSGTLRVGAVSTAEYWLPRVLRSYVDANPRVKIDLHVTGRGEVTRKLAAHEIDVAIMGRPPEELRVTATPFAKNPMAFVAAPDHPLMSEGRLTIGRLSEANLLVRESGSASRVTVERLFRDAGLRLRVGSELASNESIKQMCAAGFGPAYLSLHTCVLEMRAGLLALLPLARNPVERDWYVVRIANQQLPQVAVAFESFLRDRGQSEIDRQVGGLPQRPVSRSGRGGALQGSKASRDGDARRVVAAGPDAGGSAGVGTMRRVDALARRGPR
jgi:DNA-binding transcriptional LysR family regulator